MGKMQFPIEVSGIKTDPLYQDHNKPNGLFGSKCGQLVQVRPCGKEHGDKTYLGILLGDLPLEIFVSHDRNTKELTISGYHNPAIFVPELQAIIWGCESWWGKIESEEELHQISDDEIQNVWYVKMLKTMQEKEASNDSK